MSVTSLMGHGIFFKQLKKKLWEINFVLERDIGTFRRLYIKDMDLTDLAVNEASRDLVHEKGLKPPYKLK